MERILLVEPNYKNKYPPIGLMKISSYFKSKGDFVVFHKGLLPQAEVICFDKVLITTLFTFDFEMCVETIRYYIAILGINKIFVGGIAATIMPQRFETAIPGVHILKGQLTTSSTLGYEDNTNIDILELDYDILLDISYVYPAADSYFIYTSRGCPRKCDFCAVKTLEPRFYECACISEQITRVDKHFGIKKQLLIMDNNALYARNFEESVNTFVELGFGINNNTIKKNNSMPFYVQSLLKRIEIGKHYHHLLQIIKKEFINVKSSRISIADSLELQNALHVIEKQDDDCFITYLKDNQTYICDFFSRYNYHTISRFIDYNQGLDCRFFDDKRARILSRLAIKPCRFAFDDLKTKDDYFSAMDLAAHYGIKHFSNYLLYNYKDSPKELWNRISLNIDFCETHKEISSLFSFPMKYASIEHTNRNYIGKKWNKKYLKSINVILNVTSGIVAKEKDFFLRAFGSNENEFLEILSMPDDFIRYRDYFDHYNLIQRWQKEYRKLSKRQQNELIDLLSKCEKEVDVLDSPHNEELNRILLFYTVRKSMLEKNKLFYLQLFNDD